MFNPKQHIQNGESFALWKLPHSERVKAVVCERTEAFTPNILKQNTTGFAFVPFDTSDTAAPLFLEGAIETITVLNLATQLNAYHLKAESVAVESRESYTHNVGNAVEEIKNGTLKKVVVARNTVWEAPDNFCPLAFFKSLCEKYPETFVSLVSIKGVGTWIGATPEILLKVNHEQLTTVALAGTQLKGNAQWTEKESEEQLWVVRYIENILSDYQVNNVDISARKRITNGDLEHLYTQIDFKKTGVDNKILAANILSRLHPTPAVGGIEKNDALEFIHSNENFDRDYYSGFLGEVNVDTINLYVNLRCMQITGNGLIGYAGAGITKDSNPEKELQETDNKLNNLKSLLNK